MKNLSAALKAHIQGEVTTVCTCISIKRRDGTVFGLTDHDQPVVTDGQRFVPFDSFARLSISNSSELEVDGLEINGILNSTFVAREDIGSGLFDFAEIIILLVNYVDPTMGSMILRRGWLGEIEMNEDDSFHAEIRGLTQVLSYRVGGSYAPECDADLGDRRCKIGLDPSFWKPSTPYRIGEFVIGHIDPASGYSNASMINAGYDDDTPPVTVRQPIGWVAYGDINGRWRVAPSFGGIVQPPGQAYLIGVTNSPATTTTSELGLFQDVSLSGSGVDLTSVDTGICRISFRYVVAVANGDSMTRVRLFANLEDGSQRTIHDSGFKKYALERWVFQDVDNLLIPPKTRSIRVDFLGKKKPTDLSGPMFGSVRLVFNDPTGTYNSDAQSSGVIFQAQTAGITGETEPAFTTSLGSTFVDGGVSWTCVASFKSVDVVTSVDSPQEFGCALTQDSGFFDGGLLLWETGRNAGRGTSIKTWDGSSLTLMQRMFYPIEVGDRFVVHAGCDKRPFTCINKFNNYRNFRGFPDIPGPDAYVLRNPSG